MKNTEVTLLEQIENTGELYKLLRCIRHKTAWTDKRSNGVSLLLKSATHDHWVMIISKDWQ